MAAMQNLYWLINSYLAFYIFHFSFWHFSMTTLLQLGVFTILVIYIYVLLQFPDMSRPFELSTDASDTGIGCILSQRNDSGRDQPVLFASKTLKKMAQAR